MYWGEELARSTAALVIGVTINKTFFCLYQKDLESVSRVDLTSVREVCASDFVLLSVSLQLV